MCRGKTLVYYLGRNEKTKVIVKLQKHGQGPPGREPVISEEERKQMMLHAYRRQEDLKVQADHYYLWICKIISVETVMLEFDHYLVIYIFSTFQ
jgi:Protein of unknown function (DUF2870).